MKGKAAEVWGISMGIWRVEIARLQNASVQLFLQADEGRKAGQKGKGRADGRLVQTIDMWDFGGLRFTSACERGPPVCSN